MTIVDLQSPSASNKSFRLTIWDPTKYERIANPVSYHPKRRRARRTKGWNLPRETRAAICLLFLLAFPGGVIFPPGLSTLADFAASTAEDRAVIIKSPAEEEATTMDFHIRRALLKKGDFPPDEKVGDDGKKCWIFTHLPKSGGSTIRDLMRSKWTRASYTKYGNPEWKYGEKCARRILGEEWRVIAGSHAEALRRLLSLSFGDLSPDNIMTWARNAGKPVGASGWFLQRKFMEAHSDRHDVPDAALYDMLTPVKELVNTSFAAVGLLENFDATLLLFDRALQMPGETWPQWYRKIGKRNVGGVNKREEEAALEQAWEDPRFKHFLKLDLELYEHAVKVHHEMLERYGVK